MSIAVDLRYGSPTFKKWIGEVLSESNRKQLYIPKGFGHCCMSLVDMTEGQYKVDTWYEPRFEGRIRWDDPEIGIQWPNIAAIVSEKDRTAPYFRDADMGFTMT